MRRNAHLIVVAVVVLALLWLLLAGLNNLFNTISQIADI